MAGLNSAVARLEALSLRGGSAAESGGDDASATDPSIVAFEDFMGTYFARVSSVAEKIGGQFLEVTKIVEQALNMQKELLIKIKQTQILVEYESKDPNHVEWAKALKELYVPGLRDYVESHYPLGPVWSATAQAKAAAPSAPAPPPPPPASLFTSESSAPSSSKPKEGIAAVFQEISSGKPVTAGNLLRDYYVKSHYPLGPVLSATAQAKAAAPSAPARPASLFTSGKPVTAEMEVLMEKKLTQTDIEYRLAFPTSSLWAFPMPEGETSVYFEATDTLENEWNFMLSIRGENYRYTKPVITGDWLQFVRDKGLQVGDKLFLTREEGVNGVRYSIRAERKILNCWLVVQ